QVMEQSPVDPLFAAPSHPYTRGLLHALPRVDHEGDELASIPGTPPNMMRAPKGCPFAPRCDFEVESCTRAFSPLIEFTPGRLRACNRKVEELA
ncbi:MAG: oligopeptide ABC transporter ATP-binding protein OppD, partial [Akkermansiaceae bacterium]|nr:oligopeptide ABC transporter ATP-binding protein OppD [Akkermansiaceae bacterium]